MSRQVDPEDAAHSRRAYTGELRRGLVLLGADDDRFVQLTATTDAARPRIRPPLVWRPRTEGTSFVHARREVIELFDVPERFERAVLLGDPGSGKSTCLQEIARRQLDRIDDGDPAAFERLPLYASLSEWTNTSMPALEFLRSRLALLVGPASYYVHHFESMVADGQFLFLLDGLNELPGRRGAAAEGRHELGGADSAGVDLTRIRPGIIDSRERSLRDLAASVGVRCRFTLACRSHEYFDSLQWAVVQIAPIGDEQVDQVIDAYLPPELARGLKATMRTSPTLRGIAANPFFLHSIIGAYRPGFEPASRGEVLSTLLDSLLERVRDRAGSSPASREEIVAVAGRTAFHMLTKGRIGNQAAIDAGARELRAIEPLVDTGLAVRRGGSLYFRHQIVQEFLAAAALRDGAVRRSIKRLLTDKRYSETVSLWADLDPGRTHRRLVSALRARNLPWRRPRSATAGLLTPFYLISTMAFVLVGLTYLFDAVSGPVHALTSPIGYLPVRPWQILIGLLLIRVIWKCFQYHAAVISNAAYVLGRSGRPEHIIDVISAFRRVSAESNRTAIAQSLATFGQTATGPAVHGAISRNWRVRAGSVVTLGEIVQRDSGDRRATDALIALSAADDTGLAASLVSGLAWCQDDRVPAALARLLDESTSQSQSHSVGKGLAVFGHSRRWASSAADPEVTDEFDRLMRSHPSPLVRATAARAMGWLALPGCEERLASLAVDAEQSDLVRGCAVSALGFVRTSEAVTALVRLAEDQVKQEDAVRDALESAGAIAAMSGLRVAATNYLGSVRVGVARALGRVGDDEALALLDQLASDEDPDVRRAAATGLGRANRADALAALLRLARDTEYPVRADAVSVIATAYPDLAPTELMGLADDVEYPDRVEVVRRLGRFARPDVAAVLRLLAADSSRAVRDAAAQAGPLGATDTWLRRARWKLRHPLRATGARINAWLHLDGLRSLWRQERLAQSNRSEALSQVTNRMANDAEMARRYRRVTMIIGGVLVVLWTVFMALVLGLLRLSLVALDLLTAYWVVLIAAPVVVLLMYIVENGVDDEHPPIPRVLRGLFAILYAVAIPIVAVELIGGLAWLWWCALLVILLIWLWRKQLVARRRHRSWQSIVALLGSTDVR